MKILLVNVDSRWNLAIRRLYNYYLRKGDEVEMLDLKFSAFPHSKTKTIDAQGYDKVYVSNIFILNKDRVTVENCGDVNWGGVGSNFPLNRLPEDIDSTPPFYYPDETMARGFITRGCIRNCYFCNVSKTEGRIHFYNTPEQVIGDFKSVNLMDNNILAYEHHKDVLRWLIDHKIQTFFQQGFDFRLLDDENAELISKLRSKNCFVFAFDDIKYMSIWKEKVKLIKKYITTPYKVRVYIYVNPDMPIVDTIRRIEFCREHEMLPYIMRDASVLTLEDKYLRSFYADVCAYCNQPSMFKKVDFRDFMMKRVNYNDDRRDYEIKTWYDALVSIPKE